MKRVLVLAAWLIAIAPPSIAPAQTDVDAPPSLPPAQTDVADQPLHECDASRAQFAVGQRYSKQLAERARRAAHARVVRALEPGTMYTMEFDGGRLSIYLNSRGTVKSVKCG